MVAPLPGDIYRIVAPVADAPEEPSASFVQQILDDRGLGPGRMVVTDVIWGSRFRIQDAVALADALAAVLGGAPDSVLDEYSAARRPIAQQVVEMTDRLTRLATLPRAARQIRNTAISLVGRIPSVRRALAMRLSGLVNR